MLALILFFIIAAAAKRNKERKYAKSFSALTPTNCPDLFGVFKPALLKLYNENDPTDFADLLSDDNFVNCLNTNVNCNNKTELISQYLGAASLLSNYRIKFYEIKLGTNWIQSNIRITYTTTIANGACSYDVNGAFHLYCDENGKITEDTDFLNEEEFMNAIQNAVNPNGCSPSPTKLVKMKSRRSSSENP